MSWAHLHLALTHVPVVGVILAVLLLGVAAVRRNPELIGASYWLLVLLAATAIVVYFTGEPAEELVEGLPGYSEALVEHHEDIALLATIGMAVLGVAAAGGLIFARRPAGTPSSKYAKIVLLLGVVVGGLLAWTANLGGQIRHTEIRPAAQAGMPAAFPRD